MPLSLRAACHSESLIRKSRFIGCVEPVADRAAALQVVDALQRRHADASHVCWAMLAGGQSAAVDAGEPSGTAGRPMLEVLRHHDLDGVLATVVRYYGGVKLGAGGLLRAYTDSVAQALLGAAKIPFERVVRLRCELPYALEGHFRRELEAAGAQIEQVSHGVAVGLSFRLREAAAPALVAGLNNAGHGRINWFDVAD